MRENVRAREGALANGRPPSGRGRGLAGAGRAARAPRAGKGRGRPGEGREGWPGEGAERRRRRRRRGCRSLWEPGKGEAGASERLSPRGGGGGGREGATAGAGALLLLRGRQQERQRRRPAPAMPNKNKKEKVSRGPGHGTGRREGEGAAREGGRELPGSGARRGSGSCALTPPDAGVLRALGAPLCPLPGWGRGRVAPGRRCPGRGGGPDGRRGHPGRRARWA